MGSTTFELVALSQTCDPITNTCGIGSLFNYEPCYAVGPGGGDMFESTYVIAERQLNKAMELFDDKTDSFGIFWVPWQSQMHPPIFF